MLRCGHAPTIRRIRSGHHPGNPPTSVPGPTPANRLSRVTGASTEVGCEIETTGDDDSTATAEDPNRRRGLRLWGPAAVAYVACSLWLTRGVWRHPTTSWIGVAGDPQAFMWWLAWVPHAIGNGLNPLHPTVVQYPLGTNALWNTSVLLPGLILAPVTWAFGPVLSWNIVQAGAPVLSALVAMAALRRFVDRGFPAFVGGLVYGFSPYMSLKMLAHMNLAITVFAPLLVLCLHELFVRRRRSPKLVGAALGLAVVAQLLTGEEALLITVIAGATACAVLAVAVHRMPAAPWRAGLRGLAVAVVVAAVVGTPLLVYQFAGPQSAPCCIQGVDKYVLDSQAVVVPSTFQFFHFPGATEMAERWQGQSESNGYLGVALLAVLIVAVVALRRRRAVQVAAAVVVLLTLFSFGNEIQFAGAGTGVPGPWRLLHQLPMFGTIVVARFMFVTYLAVAVIVAIALDTILARRRTAGSMALLTATLVAVASLAPATAWVAHDHTPAFFRDDAAMDRLLPDPTIAVVSPYFPTDAMLWQATSGFRFSMIEGGVFIPGPNGHPTHNGPMLGLAVRLNSLESGDSRAHTDTTPDERRQFRSELARYGVTTMIVGPSPGRAAVERFVADLTGDAGTTTGGVTVFPVGR